LRASASSEARLFREGGTGDLRATFDLAQLALRDLDGRMGSTPGLSRRRDDVDELWPRRRPLAEFIAAQDGCTWICEAGDEIVGFARVVRFDGMEQLCEMFVHPDHQGQGIGRGLLERCWADPPTPELARVVVATGGPADLSLYTGFGVMPANGRLRLVERTERYVESRLRERDAREPAVHVLEGERALAEWARMEPEVLGHSRARLQDFFARERTCLATMGEDGRATALCWVSGDRDIGPGIAASAEDLVPVVLTALDRVAKTVEPEELTVPCSGTSWWLLRRLRTLGFRVVWPGWVLCSVPLPELYRYLPMDPGVFL
jgi:GNAT superfamily N-acetyltransferase